MTSEKGDSHQIWVILIANEAWPRPEVAAGFQPAGSPGPGWFMCRLKTCTHVKATSRRPADGIFFLESLS